MLLEIHFKDSYPIVPSKIDEMPHIINEITIVKNPGCSGLLLESKLYTPTKDNIVPPSMLIIFIAV